MTVKEIKEALSKYPDTMDVFIDERYTEFKFGLVNSVTCREIDFCENPTGPVLATELSIVLSEQ